MAEMTATPSANGHANGDDLLRVENLVKYYPVRGGLLYRTVAEVKAVDDVSFAVKPGETFGLVGESGCGKTTVGQTIIRLHDPTDGQIVFEGQDIAKLGPRQMRPIRRDIQMIFQDPSASLDPRMTVGSVIEEPLNINA